MYVPERKLTIEVHELGQCTRDLKSENKRQKRIEEELGCNLLELIYQDKF